MLKWEGKFIIDRLNFANFFVQWKMEKNWSNFIQNFNESSQYLVKVFSVLNFWFNKISFCFVSIMNEIFRFSQHSQLPSTQSLSVRVRLLNVWQKVCSMTSLQLKIEKKKLIIECSRWTPNETARFKKWKQLFEYKHLL